MNGEPCMVKYWRCDSTCCDEPWHRAYYYKEYDLIDGSETWLEDKYGDGDVEHCDVDELPTPTQCEQSLVGYLTWVAAHKTDPLDVMTVKDTYVQRQRWRVDYLLSITGVRVHFRHGRKGMIMYSPKLHAVPPEVLDFFDAVPYTAGAAKNAGSWTLDGSWKESARGNSYSQAFYDFRIAVKRNAKLTGVRLLRSKWPHYKFTCEHVVPVRVKRTEKQYKRLLTQEARRKLELLRQEAA